MTKSKKIKLKPAIYKDKGWWACSDGIRLGAGITPKVAFYNWLFQFYN